MPLLWTGEEPKAKKLLAVGCWLLAPLMSWVGHAVFGMYCGADPPVRGALWAGPPGRPPRSGRDLILREKSGSRGTRADQGVRPTNYALACPPSIAPQARHESQKPKAKSQKLKADS